MKILVSARRDGGCGVPAGRGAWGTPQHRGAAHPKSGAGAGHGALPVPAGSAGPRPRQRGRPAPGPPPPAGSERGPGTQRSPLRPRAAPRPGRPDTPLRGAGARGRAWRNPPAPLPGPALPDAGVHGGGLRAVRPALLPRLPAALLPGPGGAGPPHGTHRPQLTGVQPRPRREATGASAVPPLRHCLQLGADAGLAPGTGHRRAGVRPAHEPCPHRRLRGGRGGAEHHPGGVAHQRPAAAQEPALLLPAVPGDPLHHLGASEEDEPAEGGLDLPGAAEGDGDVPPPADLHPDRGEDGVLRRCFPERDGEEQDEVRLLPEHGLVHHDPGHGAVRADLRLRHGQRQLLQGEEPLERALPLLREGPAGRVQDVPGARASPPRRAPLHHRESYLLPLGQEEEHRLHPPVLGRRVGHQPWGEAAGTPAAGRLSSCNDVSQLCRCHG